MENLLPAIPHNVSGASEVVSWATFEITTDLDAQCATERLQVIKHKQKQMDAFREEFIRPQKRILADFEAKCRDAMRPFVEVETLLRKKLGAFMDRERARKHQEAEALRLKELEAAKLREQAMQEKILLEGNSDIPIEATQAHIRTLETLDVTTLRQSVQTTSDNVAESIHWVWEIEDINKIPREYFCIDEKKINEIAKKYSKEPLQIPGLVFTQKARVIVR